MSGAVGIDSDSELVSEAVALSSDLFPRSAVVCGVVDFVKVISDHFSDDRDATVDRIDFSGLFEAGNFDPAIAAIIAAMEAVEMGEPKPMSNFVVDPKEARGAGETLAPGFGPSDSFIAAAEDADVFETEVAVIAFCAQAGAPNEF